MLSVSRVFTNTANSVSESAKQLAPVLKTFIPYVFAATICLGLREQTLFVSTETLISINRRVLEGATGILGCMALKSIWDGSNQNAPHLYNRKAVKHSINDKEITEEISLLREEITRLKQELDETNKKFNPNYVDPKTLMVDDNGLKQS